MSKTNKKKSSSSSSSSMTDKPSRKPTKKNFDSCGVFIRRILSSIFKDNEIFMASSSILVFDQIINSIVKRLTEESGELAKSTKKQTISVHDLKCALSLLIKDKEYLNEMFTSIDKAIHRFSIENEKIISDGTTRKPRSSSIKTGLTLSVPRIRTKMKHHSSSNYRKGKSVSIAMTASVEFLIRDIMRFSHESISRDKRKTLQRKDISFSILNNKDIFQSILHNPSFYSGSDGMNLLQKLTLIEDSKKKQQMEYEKTRKSKSK